MMKFTADREVLLRPLQLVTGVVERRHTLPVLANVLVQAKDGEVRITGTDLEVSLSVTARGVVVEGEGTTTIPARKLTDIWRSLPEIGDAFGGRDHTTVLHACKRIAELKEQSADVSEDYKNLSRLLLNS